MLGGGYLERITGGEKGVLAPYGSIKAIADIDKLTIGHIDDYGVYVPNNSNSNRITSE